MRFAALAELDGRLEEARTWFEHDLAVADKLTAAARDRGRLRGGLTNGGVAIASAPHGGAERVDEKWYVGDQGPCGARRHVRHSER
ncbi:MAG: hypothetical protein E6J90_04520 [Deltaproteobacteria bacterium]|nr:MAG: hypothetical protein E6J90_04520 [Deltaproteobacteria bacterium]